MAKEFVCQQFAVATENKGVRQHSKSYYFARFTIFLMCISATVYCVFTCLTSGIFCYMEISGKSMMTEINANGKDEDRAWVYRFGKIEHGTIIVSRIYYEDTGASFAISEYPYFDKHGRYMTVIKRAIALQGDQLSVERELKIGATSLSSFYSYDYFIVINGERIVEEYLDPKVANPTAENYIRLWRVLNEPNNSSLRSDWKALPYSSCVKNGVLTIPNGYIFMMGDNRGGNVAEFNRSWDSSSFGPQKLSNVRGTCIEIVHESIDMFEYLWNKFLYYISFAWAR